MRCRSAGVVVAARQTAGRSAATSFKVFRMWYNPSLHRVLRMILGGAGKDVAHGDTRSVRRTLPCGRHGPGDVGEAAPARTAGSDLRGRQAPTIPHATALPSRPRRGGA